MPALPWLMREQAGQGLGRSRWSSGARLVVQAWLGTRLVLALVFVTILLTTGRSFEETLGNWDAAHYLAIAESGYADETKYAFFPGWPLVLRLVGLTGLPLVVVGSVLALVFSAAAAAALYRLAGTAAAAAWLFAPTAIFTAVPYSESLFCAAAFWAWERASARRWGQAAALAAVAASVRVSGVFLIGALVILAVTQRRDAAPHGSGRYGRLPRWNWRPRLSALAWLLVPVGVVGAYTVYLYRQTGSWTAWLNAQTSGWAREFTLPWESLQHTIEATTPGMFAATPAAEWVFKAEIVSMAVGVLVTCYALLRRRWAEAGWVGVQVLAFSTSYWFMSVNRAVLLWFPLWVLVGRLVEGRGKPSPTRYLVVGVVAFEALLLQVRWAYVFLTGDWAS